MQGPEYLKRTLLCNVPDLGNRVLEIRQGKAATSAAENDRQLQQSQVSRRNVYCVVYALLGIASANAKKAHAMETRLLMTSQSHTTDGGFCPQIG